MTMVATIAGDGEATVKPRRIYRPRKHRGARMTLDDAICVGLREAVAMDDEYRRFLAWCEERGGCRISQTQRHFLVTCSQAVRWVDRAYLEGYLDGPDKDFWRRWIGRKRDEIHTSA